jgi:hypothetical protein
MDLARSARESLGVALAALQRQELPLSLLDISGQVAKAMALLQRYENAPDVATAREALLAVRTALGVLQTSSSELPAVVTATDIVARALGLVHSLSERAATNRPRGTVLVGGAVAALPPDATDTVKDVAVARRQAEHPQGSAASDQPGQCVEVFLGLHSPSNLYRGVSADIVADGGVFVATYKLLPLGQRVLLRIGLPGNLEFEAEGVVRWHRDSRLANEDNSPGYGVKMTSVTEPGRRLLSRYAALREPLFHEPD